MLKPTEAAGWEPAALAGGFQSCTQGAYKRQATGIDLGGEEETGPRHNGSRDKGSTAAAQLLNAAGVREALSCWKAPSSARHAGHCPWDVPGTATKNSHSPTRELWWRVPGWLPVWHSCMPGFAPCPAPTGLFSSGRRDQPYPVALLPHAVPEELLHCHPATKAFLYARAATDLQWCQSPVDGGPGRDSTRLV